MSELKDYLLTHQSPSESISYAARIGNPIVFLQKRTFVDNIYKSGM